MDQRILLFMAEVVVTLIPVKAQYILAICSILLQREISFHASRELFHGVVSYSMVFIVPTQYECT